MKIIDVSHWNKVTDWKKVKDDGVEAVIMKVSQGDSFVDPKFEEYRKGARSVGLLVGYYHFADGRDAGKEANHFVKTIGNMQVGEFLALDWEIPHPKATIWSKEFLDHVLALTSIRPLFYTNEYRVISFDWSGVVAGNYGLWVAKYGANDGKMGADPKRGQWPFIAIWQYTSRGKVNGIDGFVDINYAPMKLETLKKYGKVTTDTTTEKNYTTYSQNDPRWKDIVIGRSGSKVYKMGDFGCFVTSLGNMKKMNPEDTFVTLRKLGGITDTGLVKTVEAAKALGLEVIPTGDKAIVNRDYNINNMPDWSPSIKEVDGSPSAGKQQHFVLRIIEDGQRYIIDSWDGQKKKINHYPFISYRLFRN